VTATATGSINTLPTGARRGRSGVEYSEAGGGGPPAPRRGPPGGGGGPAAASRSAPVGYWLTNQSCVFHMSELVLGFWKKF
jgi:hypothetical protein